jgi:hypothetical protein
MDKEKLRKAIQLIQECLDGDEGYEEEDMEEESSDDSSEMSDKIKLAASMIKRKM